MTHTTTIVTKLLECIHPKGHKRQSQQVFKVLFLKDSNRFMPFLTLKSIHAKVIESSPRYKSRRRFAMIINGCNCLKRHNGQVIVIGGSTSLTAKTNE